MRLLLPRHCLRCRLWQQQWQQQQHGQTFSASSWASSFTATTTLPPRAFLAPITSVSISGIRAFSQARPLAAAADPSAPASTPALAATAPAKTFYDIFPLTLAAGPPPRGPFTIDVQALRAEFRRLQAESHPDTQPAHLRREAEAKSARLNDAFRTLADPLYRAQYLLKLRGIDVAGDEAAQVDDMEMLMQVMEAREAIEDAVEEADLEETRAANEARVEEAVAALGEAFQREDFDAAKKEAVRLKYWSNIAQALRYWEKGKPTVLMH